MDFLLQIIKDWAATTAVSTAAGGMGVIITRYLLLPSKVESLREDVKIIRERVDQLYVALIQR